jgi:alkylation response protein AidB-like acyl-CoA dehydrogenase
MPPRSGPVPREFLSALFEHAGHADAQSTWPEKSWKIVQDCGALRWSLARPYGGDGLTGVDLLTRYEDLASACLTSCFLLSQRDAACRRLQSSGQEILCQELLPKLASGARFMTVGLAQLTTSRQHGKPAVSALPAGDDFIIDGVIPWVTGASRADHLLIGAALHGGEQILAALPADLPGVSVGPPLQIAALQGSLTAEVRCAGVRLPRRWLVAGPATQVLRGERGGTGGLETSCLALGLAGAALAYISDEGTARPELVLARDRLERDHHELRGELHQFAASPVSPEAAQSLRARANAHVLRVTQAALAVSKGTGFLREHPAQRWARQALFFLVWSCPWPVTAATLGYLAGAT